MEYKTLALVLAAGKGSRVAHLFDKEHPVKPMLEVNGAPLIKIALDEVGQTGLETAVLTYDSPEFISTEEIARKSGAKVMHEVAGRSRFTPAYLELPNLIVQQYFFSADSKYLQSFDSILLMPCDLVFQGVNLGDMVKFHDSGMEAGSISQVTMLSKSKAGEGRTELFKMEGARIVSRKKYQGEILEGYEMSTQAGIYLLSNGILSRPLRVLGGFSSNVVLRYLTDGSWTDYGNPESFKR